MNIILWTLVVINVIVLMAIGGYYIHGYGWIFY